MFEIELALPEFFAKPKRVRMEEWPFTDRVYFLIGDRIVAVALRKTGGKP